MRPTLVACVLILCSGCTTGTGAKWYAPATWFSHRPADVADAANAKRSSAQDAAIKAAQRTAHETQIALGEAPESRPVEVARESNDVTVQLLDQAAGPLTAGDSAKLRATVAGLLSENATLRERAERERASSRENIADISKRLADAEASLYSANARLRVAFDRENALANQLRSQRALMWILASIAVIIAAAWFYVKLIYGGLPLAAGKFMRDLRSSHPDAAKLAEPLFDSYLNRHEQELIARHAR